MRVSSFAIWAIRLQEDQLAFASPIPGSAVENSPTSAANVAYPPPTTTPPPAGPDRVKCRRTGVSARTVCGSAMSIPCNFAA